MCCGFIGTGKGSFCLKKATQCSVAIHNSSHVSSKFTPTVNTYYVCKSQEKVSALCEVSIATKYISTFTVDMDQQRSIAEWRALIQTLGSSSSVLTSQNAIENSIEAITKMDVTSFLKTPKKIPKSLTKSSMLTKQETLSSDDFLKIKQSLMF